MSSSAAKKSVPPAGVPSVMGTWTQLRVVNDRNLGVLDSIEITSQVEGVDNDLIFGNVKSIAPVTAYAIEHGTVTAEGISFQLSIQGIVYTFQGKVGDSSISGHVTPPWSGDGHTEEGSWSAQAKPGPGEEDKKPHGKHTKRVSQ